MNGYISMICWLAISSYSRYVIETGPKVDYRPYLQTVLSVTPDLPQQGSIDPSMRMDSLLFALLAEAVADIRRIRDAHRGEEAHTNDHGDE